LSAPYLTLLLAVVFVSFGAPLVRLAPAPPLAIAFFRVGLASILLAPFALGGLRRSWPSLDRRSRVSVVLSGIALALHFATWIASLSYTSIASSVLLVNTAPLFAIVLSRIFLGERTPAIVLLAMPLALGGAALIAFADWTGSPGTLVGNLLALAGAATLAAYHVVGRGMRGALPLDAYVLAVWATAALALLALCLGFGVPLRGHSAQAWLAFLGLALVPTLGGHGLVNRSLRALAAPTVGLFLLGEPVGASILAWLLFGEVPARWTLAGGVLVLAALVLVLVKSHPLGPQSSR
jgi:drug/metabolite transporter (DMT)-like permease